MKKILFLTLALWSVAGQADWVATGQITRFHVSPGNFAIYLTTTEGCPSDWYYTTKNDMDMFLWQKLFDLSLTAYENGKIVSVFANSSQCGLQEFTAMDTVN